MDSVAEVWKPIPCHDGYEVSNRGEVRSLDRMVWRRNRSGVLGLYPWKGRVHKLTQHRGYLVVTLTARIQFGVHQLVMLAFVGVPSEGLVVNHINGIKTDNRLENLEYTTNRDNVLHAYRTSLLSNKGETNGRAKLTEGQVVLIIEMLPHRPRREIAAIFGCRSYIVDRIASGKLWRHVPRPENQLAQGA